MMQSEKTWALLLGALITAMGGIIAAIIMVDAERDRERLEAALAEKESEIRKFEEKAEGPAPEKQPDIDVPTQAAQGVDRTLDPQSTSAPSRGSQSADAATSSAETASSEMEPPKAAIGTYRGSSFSFDLFGCERSGDRARCSLTVTNLTDEARGLNLCGEGELVDDAGRELRTRVRFSGGNSCGVLRLPPDLPRALEMYADAYSDSRRLSIVLGDVVAFRDIEIGQARP